MIKFLHSAKAKAKAAKAMKEGNSMRKLTVLGLFISILMLSARVAQSDIIRIEGRSLILCASLNVMQRVQKITEATRKLPDDAKDGCWRVSPPIELIILDQFGGFVLITYKEPMSRDWYRGTAYTPTTWLDGSGVRFSN